MFYELLMILTGLMVVLVIFTIDKFCDWYDDMVYSAAGRSKGSVLGVLYTLPIMLVVGILVIMLNFN